MSSSFRYPVGAQVIFHSFGAVDARTWARDYAGLVDDVRCRAARAFPSFDPIDCWRGCDARVVLRNAYADIGVSTFETRAAIWLAQRGDRAFRLRCQWGGTGEAARVWLDRSAVTFAALFSPHDAVPSVLPLAA